MRNLILTQMASDARVPREAMGFVATLQADDVATDVALTALMSLNKYVPDLVSEYLK